MKKYFIKTLLLFSILGLSFNSVKSQYVTIPDAVFRNWLTTNYPACMNGNQLDTTCIDVVNEEYIVLPGTTVADFTGLQYFDNLKKFSFSFAYNLSSLPPLPKKITYLQCPNSNLTSLPQLPDSLETLICFFNQLTSLPPLPATLKKLECRQNPILNLPQLPDSLLYLNCAANGLTYLPTLPNSLLELTAGDDSLTSLPLLPENLRKLYIIRTLITTLPTLPNKVHNLVCKENFITSLPPLPDSLIYLDCNNNQLTNLPLLPNKISTLLLDSNLLSSLPNLPNSLKLIKCSNNNLTSLPTLPINLDRLFTYNNLLTQLPNLPSTLTMLQIANNNISCLPILPNSINASTITNFNIGNNPITCFPNYIPGMDSAMLAMPLCQTNDIVNNPNNCSFASNINGNLYIDNDNNCLYSTIDFGLLNIKLNFYNPFTNQFGSVYSAAGGHYEYTCLSGTNLVVLDTVNKPYKSNCIFPGIDTLVVTNSSNPQASNVDFDIVCKNGLDLGVQSIVLKSGVAFPGQEHWLQINAGDFSHWFGLNCSNGAYGQVHVTVTGPVQYLSSDSLVPIVSGNTFIYDISDFGAINNLTAFQLLFETDTSAQAGDQICVHVEVTPVTGELNPSNNIKDFCYSVVNSYDPNYKEVFPTDVQPGFQDWLTYTVHFQNLGTAPAINIRLLDTLDANLDEQTFEVINYSHYNNVTLMNGILDFRFPNILLPDSASNPAGSQGFVQYRIKPKANLIAGTQIENTAHIYFDYNPAVATNTTVNNFITTVGNSTLKQSSTMKIYPNPSNGIFTISAAANIEVFNLIGDLILLENNTTSIDLTAAPKGMYFVKLNGGRIEKLVKN
jgi:uncharacterized repeat protein (TIGR01451 family)